ncbi:unnamed protein product [Porites lobata]|uniref:B box-type domain-containing protein n=1 Tax=Porites lobata TaxID=104759 RepID=A0ABN8MYG0_9CNID|nr:unnamed protein product [Porites lobata]
MFDLEGKFISKFGKQGENEGEFDGPYYLLVNKEGLLMVCDAGNNRVQVFELSGKFVAKFGSEGSERGEFDCPGSIASLSDGRIVVTHCKICANDRTYKAINSLSKLPMMLKNNMYTRFQNKTAQTPTQPDGAAHTHIAYIREYPPGKLCCCSFWCEECMLGHNIIRTNKEHKTLALKDFQDQDIEAVLKRPAFCQKELHEKEELKFFCKKCQVAICNSCAMTLHEGHGKMLLQEATNARKTKINSMIKSLKDKALEKRKEVEQFNQKSMEVQAKVADVKSQVQTNVDQMIAIIEARKQDVFDAVDDQANKSLETLSQKKGKVENQVKIIESAVAQTESLMKRNFSTEILGFKETFDKILQEQGTQENRDTECTPQFSFTKSEKLINVLNSEGIGNVKTVFSETKSQQSGAKGKESNKVISGNKGANIRDSLLEAQVQTKRFRFVLSFGQYGKSVGMLNGPWGVAVNDRDEIAVTELWNHRVSVYSSDGIHLRSFGGEGEENGELNQPSGIAFDSHGNIIVADCNNDRVQVFDRNGKFLRKFGKHGTLDHKLKNPEGLSINGQSYIIVSDRDNKLIKIFSSNGEYLGKFGGAGSLVSPYHCIQHGQYLIVSDCDDHSIKMFDLEGKFIFKFGKQGNKDGEFNEPSYLSVNKQ